MQIFFKKPGTFQNSWTRDYPGSKSGTVPIKSVRVVNLNKMEIFQLLVAAILSAGYGLVMMMVFIGVAMQINEDGILAPSSLFFFLMMGENFSANASLFS